MATTTILDFIDAIATQLEARAGLTGVDVFTAHPGDDLTRNCIVFTEILGNQEEGRMGPSNDERYSAEGFIYILKPGKGEAVAKDARDTAKGHLNELESQLTTDATVNNTVGYARLDTLELRQGFNPDGRWSEIRFTIDVLSIL